MPKRKEQKYKDKLKEKEDIEVFILYLSDKIGYPMTKEDLHSVCILDDFVNSFDFIECFDELLTSENLEIIKGEPARYVPTERGRLVADTLNGNIPHYMKEKALKSALKFLDFEKRGTSIETSAYEKPHGKYEFVCSLKEGNETLLDMKLTLDSYRQLEKISHNFSEKPEHVYLGILSILSGDADYLLK